MDVAEIMTFRSSDIIPRANPGSIDQEDEALNRWKASLGLGSGNPVADPNDPRKCVIKSLALVHFLPLATASTVADLLSRKSKADPTSPLTSLPLAQWRHSRTSPLPSKKAAGIR